MNKTKKNANTTDRNAKAIRTKTHDEQKNKPN